MMAQAIFIGPGLYMVALTISRWPRVFMMAYAIFR